MYNTGRATATTTKKGDDTDAERAKRARGRSQGYGMRERSGKVQAKRNDGAKQGNRENQAVGENIYRREASLIGANVIREQRKGEDGYK